MGTDAGDNGDGDMVKLNVNYPALTFAYARV